MSFYKKAISAGAAAALALLLGQVPQHAFAQTSTEQAAASAPAATEPVLLSAEELETLVARIALYPDDLVALVLSGSLNPLQIVQAARFLDEVKTKPELKPNASWDGSVISLLNYPQVVTMMNDDLDWTEQMGEAVVNQQKDVLLAIQQLRDKAVANGVIKTDEKVVVETKNDNVVIRPAKAEVTYVPQYDPVILTDPTYVAAPSAVIYGDPYPSYYYPYAPYWAGFITGAVWGAAVDWDHWHSWGGDVDIDVDINDIDIDKFKFDKDKFNNIDWDSNKFNFDRDKITNNIKNNNFNRLDLKHDNKIGKIGNINNLPGRAKIDSRDVRRDVQQTLKQKDPAGNKIADRKPAGGKLADRKPGQAAGKLPDRKPGQGAGKVNRKPSKAHEARADRPRAKPAARVDHRPRQPSAMGNYSRGRDARASSNRGHVSRGGGGGRPGHGGGARIRRH